MAISLSCDQIEHMWSKTKKKNLTKKWSVYWKWKHIFLISQWFYTEKDIMTLISLSLCTITRFLPTFCITQGFQLPRASIRQTSFWFLNRWQIIISNSALHSHRESWWHPNTLSKAPTCSDIFSCHPSSILTDAILQVMLRVARAGNEQTDRNRRCKAFSIAQGKTLKSQSERVENSPVCSSVLPRMNLKEIKFLILQRDFRNVLTEAWLPQPAARQCHYFCLGVNCPIHRN